MHEELLPECSIRRWSWSMHGNLPLVCTAMDDQRQAAHRQHKFNMNGRLLADHTNYIRRAVHKWHSWMLSDSAHDFSVKLSLFMCSRSSCLLKLTPTMSYIFLVKSYGRVIHEIRTCDESRVHKVSYTIYYLPWVWRHRPDGVRLASYHWSRQS